MNVHYNPVSGEILAFDTNDVHGAPGQAIPGCAVLSVAGFVHLDVTKQKVADGAVVAKNASEVAFYHLPAEYEVRAARAAEMLATDWTDTAPHLRADGDGDDEPHRYRSAWQTYRQTLRDLGSISNPVEMLDAWPPRPDGTDPVAMLRARV
jgi:hypothetical protein